jgi:hypothetical protein
MTWTLVQQETGTWGNTSAVLPAASTVGNLLVIKIFGFAYSFATTPSLPAGWRLAIDNYNNGLASFFMRSMTFYYPNNPGGITSVAISGMTGGTSQQTGGSNYSTIEEYHDSTGSNVRLDQVGIAPVATVASPFPVATAGITAAANELAVSAISELLTAASAANLTAGTGFTQAGNGGTNGFSSTVHVASDYKLDTGAAGATVTDSIVSSVTPIKRQAAAIATFAPASSTVVLADAVGPAGGAGTSFTASPGTWTHINNGNGILIGITILTGAVNTVTGVTYGGVTIPFLGFINSAGGSTGGIALYGLVGSTVPVGSNTVSVTFSDAGSNHNAGSVSVSGAGSLGAPVTAVSAGSTGSISVSVPGTTAGGLIVATACFGGGSGGAVFSGTNNVTVRWQHDNGTGTAADNGVEGTVSSVGGAQTVGFSSNMNDSWGIVAVEVLPAAGGGPVSRPQRVRRIQGNPGAIPSQHTTTELTGASYGR